MMMMMCVEAMMYLGDKTKKKARRVASCVL